MRACVLCKGWTGLDFRTMLSQETLTVECSGARSSTHVFDAPQTPVRTFNVQRFFFSRMRGPGLLQNTSAPGALRETSRSKRMTSEGFFVAMVYEVGLCNHHTDNVTHSCGGSSTCV